MWLLGWIFENWDFLGDVYVGVGLLSCMGRTFQGQGSIPLEMFLYVCFSFSFNNLMCSQKVYFEACILTCFKYVDIATY